VNELPIFILGIAVFLITVYGAVASGGLFLTKYQLDDDPGLHPPSHGKDRSVGPIPVPDDY
jgi:hypothetical protein